MLELCCSTAPCAKHSNSTNNSVWFHANDQTPAPTTNRLLCQGRGTYLLTLEPTCNLHLHLLACTVHMRGTCQLITDMVCRRDLTWCNPVQPSSAKLAVILVVSEPVHIMSRRKYVHMILDGFLSTHLYF